MCGCVWLPTPAVLSEAVEENSKMVAYSQPIIDTAVESAAENTQRAVSNVRKAAVGAKAAKAIAKAVKRVRD